MKAGFVHAKAYAFLILTSVKDALCSIQNCKEQITLRLRIVYSCY